jgi:hypothetical protein
MGVMVAEGMDVRAGMLVADGGRTSVGRMISSSIPKQPEKKIMLMIKINIQKRNLEFIL